MIINERLKKFRSEIGLTQAEVVARTGVSDRAYQGYEAGRSVPGGEALARLVTLGLNANWLLTGAGEMFLSSGEQPNLNVDMGLLKLVITACKRSRGDEFLKLNMDDQLNFATDLYLQLEKVMSTLGVDTKDKDALSVNETGLVIKLDKVGNNPPQQPFDLNTLKIPRSKKSSKFDF